jgi:hypothetical protein
MVTLARRAHRIPFAPVVAVLFGIAAAILMAAVPVWLFEKAVVASGLPNLIAAAAPPLGLIARLLAIAAAFVSVAMLFRVLLFPISRMIDGKARVRTPWRDAGYDADADQSRGDPLPPRRPIFAPDELGAPLMSDEAIAVVQPVVAPDPSAMVEEAPVQAEPIATEMPRTVVFAPTDKDNSITTLIRRLEEGLSRRASGDPGPDGSGDGLASPPPRWIGLQNVEVFPAKQKEEDGLTKGQALGVHRTVAGG